MARDGTKYAISLEAKGGEGIEYRDENDVYRFNVSREKNTWIVLLPGTKGSCFETNVSTAEEMSVVLARVRQYLEHRRDWPFFGRRHPVVFETEAISAEMAARQLRVSEYFRNRDRDGHPVPSGQILAKCFLVTRLLEAIWIAVTLYAALAAENAVASTVADRWRYWTLSDALNVMAAVLTWYYLGFGYIIMSGLAHWAAWAGRVYFHGLTAYKYGALNVVVFSIHSILIMSFVFQDYPSPAIWAAWASAVAYNALVPVRIWRLMIRREINRSFS